LRAGQTQYRPTEWNVVLISVDTLRADRLGCYGYRNAQTPRVDELAREGIVFEQAFTPVPLTLPAHACLLTGTYPAICGVHDNGEIVSPSVPTLAEHLRSQGYQTAAFIGAFVLDRRFGLAKGFDLYEGDFHPGLLKGADPGTIEIRGDHVETAAADWIAAHKSGRFFVFVHFYDLHSPYLLPPSWRSRFRGRIYDGELSYVDDLIGHLWTSLQQSRLADRTLLVITADHGEGLGDHGERSHGFFLYSATTHIPLILRFPDRRFAGRRVSDIVRLIDIAPTICSLLGLPSLASFEGRSLSAAISGGALPAVPAYSESFVPYRYFHCAPLYAMRNQQYTYINAPRPELYDRLADPTETSNLARTAHAVTSSLREELSTLMLSFNRASTVAPVRPEVMEELRSLGYLSASIAATGMPRPDRTLPDPKDRIELFRRYQDTRDLETEGKYREAAVGLDCILGVDPMLVSVQIDAGIARQYLHQDTVALRHFKAALRVDPRNALARYNDGICLRNLHRDIEAEQEFDIAAKLEPWSSSPFDQRGLVQARQGKLQEAIASFDSAISIDAFDFDGLLNRGIQYGRLGNWAKARSDLERAVGIEPNSAQAHDALGTLSFYLGNLQEASERYQRALSLDPHASSIHVHMGLLYKKQGHLTDARAEFERALALNPADTDARRGLDGLRQPADR
jgi:tetratricopeptide (TPR) repeat protein